MADEHPRPEQRVTDVETLKALGHPLRIKLYRVLYLAREATASQLAEQVDEAVSLVSYHLRKLAAHGLIEEATGRSGDARERWWRPTTTVINARDEDFRDAPEREAVHTAVSKVFAGEWASLHDDYFDTKAAWSNEWRSAAFDAGYIMPLTAEELTGLKEELIEVVTRWWKRGEAARDAGDTEGRKNVAVYSYGIPLRD